MSEWKSTKGSGNTWNPTQDANGNPREVTPDDYRDGYYIGSKHGVGQHNATVHTIETSEGNKIDIWGTRALNGEIEKIRIGQYIRIQWLGMKLTKGGASKQAAGQRLQTTDSFHSWEVFTNESVAPLPMGAGVQATQPVAATAASAINQGAHTAQTARPTQLAVATPKVDDDLPF